MVEEESSTAKVENNVEENIKTYSQEQVDDMKAKWESGFQKKLDKAISRHMRDVEEENFKTNQLIDVLKKQTKKETIDDLLDMSEQQYGVKIPRTRDNNSKSDIKVLAEHDANEVIEDGKEVVNEEINRLANRTRNEREEEVYSRLNNFLEEQEASNKKLKEIEEIKEIGFDEKILETDEFKDFQKKFDKSTSLKDIAEMYSKLNKEPFNPGSMKDVKGNNVKEFYTEEEFHALTDKDLSNPEIFKKAMKSLNHFYKK